MIVASQTRHTSMKALALLTITAITSITATNQDISYTEMSAVLAGLSSPLIELNQRDNVVDRNDKSISVGNKQTTQPLNDGREPNYDKMTMSMGQRLQEIFEQVNYEPRGITGGGRHKPATDSPAFVWLSGSSGRTTTKRPTYYQIPRPTVSIDENEGEAIRPILSY